jgi:hypothetical protein
MKTNSIAGAARQIVTREKAAVRIAKEYGIEDLLTRHSDSADFREVAVWTLKAMLEQAFAEGQAACPECARKEAIRKNLTQTAGTCGDGNADGCPGCWQCEDDEQLPVAELAEKCSDAYSTDSYHNGWNGCIRMLRKRGYDDRQIEAILRSKWTRWTGDGSERRRYGRYTSTDLANFLDSISPADREREIQKLVDGTF